MHGACAHESAMEHAGGLTEEQPPITTLSLLTGFVSMAILSVLGSNEFVLEVSDKF